MMQAIQLAEGKTSLWMYFPHTAAMCTLIALAVCNGPLLYDFTIIYKGSLDGTVLVFVIATVLLTLVDLIGFLHIWGITIDIISSISVILAVGFCVDYSCHIAYRFLHRNGSEM